MYYFRKWQYNLKNVENKQKIEASWQQNSLKYPKHRKLENTEIKFYVINH